MTGLREEAPRWRSLLLSQYKTQGRTSAPKSMPPNSKPDCANCVRLRRPCNTWRENPFHIMNTDRRNYFCSIVDPTIQSCCIPRARIRIPDCSV